MNFEELKKESLKNNIVLTDEMIEKYDRYADLLKEWNEKINLTAIVEKEEVIEKHFFDSLLLLKYISDCKNLADIGTGEARAHPHHVDVVIHQFGAQRFEPALEGEF